MVRTNRKHIQERMAMDDLHCSPSRPPLLVPLSFSLQVHFPLLDTTEIGQAALWVGEITSFDLQGSTLLVTTIRW